MRLPTQLSRTNKKAHKNKFGHLLIIGGSERMAGAVCLSGLAALRSGSGLVTLGIPKGINSVVHKKCAHELMTLPLPQTKEQTISANAITPLKKVWTKYSVIAIGPGLSQSSNTVKFALKVIELSPAPIVIDADALNALSTHLSSIKKSKSEKILTPHPGEMARLLKMPKKSVETSRAKSARDFAKKFNCVLLLKGHRTIVASTKQIYTNTTGNPGMATAGSGDVLTGMIGAFLAQGLSGFEAAKFGSYLHGKAGDLAAKAKGRTSLIASDIIDYIPKAFKA